MAPTAAHCVVQYDTFEFQTVNLVNGEYVDSAQDIYVQVLGHRINVDRSYSEDRWRFSIEDHRLEFEYERGLNNQESLELMEKDTGVEDDDNG